MPQHNSKCILDTFNLLARALSHRNDDQEDIRLHLDSVAHRRVIQHNIELIFPGIYLFADTTTSIVINYKNTSLHKQWVCSALQVSIGLIEILANFTSGNIFTKFSIENIASCVHTMLNQSSYDDYIQVLKYSTTWMHAKSLDQPTLPEKPLCLKSNAFPLLFKNNSHLHKWLCGLINASKNKSTRNKDLDDYQHLFWSIAQVKRCAAVVPDEFIEASLHKHRKAMAKPATSVPISLKNSLVEKWTAIVNRMKFKQYSKTHEFSSSASYEASCTMGGGKGEILYHMIKYGYTTNDDLLCMAYLPLVGVTERRGFSPLKLSDLIDEIYYVYDSIEFVPYEKLSYSGDKLLERYNLEVPGFHGDRFGCSAKVHPIAEPLKIRNITKGNSFSYAIAKGMQLDIHKFMRGLPQFKLIGEPLTSSHIEWLVKKNPNGSFASGDFSAATDNISIEMTKAFFEVILDKFIIHHMLNKTHMSSDTASKYIMTLRNALYEHSIQYPKTVGDLMYPVSVEDVEQQNGQLMGSVLSFVILCAINLCTYWHTDHPEIKPKDFLKLPVLVNGDDILFRTTRSKYNIWLNTIPQVGLEPSPGKNFISDSYCTVNSQLFSIRKNKVNYIPFFNAGMLLGQSKVARQELKSKPVYLLHKEVLAGAWNQELADARFKYYNSEKLIKASTHKNGCQLNWYIPQKLGGLGMKLPKTTIVSSERAKEIGECIEHLAPYQIATTFQAKLANVLRTKWTSLYKTAPLQPYSLEKPYEEENLNFRDCIKRQPYFSCLPEFCPTPFEYRKKVADSLPNNWAMGRTPFAVDEFTDYYYKPCNFNLKNKDARLPSMNLSKLCSQELREFEYHGSHDNFNTIVF
jgi:hypothetical protein